MPKLPDDDHNDTVPVERVDPTDPALEPARHATQRGYAHVPAPEDMTPLPPPRVQASIIAEESGRHERVAVERAGGNGAAGGRTVRDGAAALGDAGDAVVGGRTDLSITGPMPLPPLPPSPATGGGRPLERASLGPRRIQLRGTLSPRQLVDPDDARWTLALWFASAVLAFVALLGSVLVIVDGARGGGGVPLGAVLIALAVLLLYPALWLGREVMEARVSAAGLEVGPDQLRDAWQLYGEVAARLGVRRPPRLFVYDAAPHERRLLGLIASRAVVVPRAALASSEGLELALARALGRQLVGHDELVDLALLAPLRLVSAVIAWPLARVGLGLSLAHRLDAARVLTEDRAACVGAGQLGLVVDDILGAGDRALATRIDSVAVEGHDAALPPSIKLTFDFASPVPAPGRRIARLQSFAAPHL